MTDINIEDGQVLTKSVKETRVDLYEAMFLLGTELTANPKAAIELVEGILQKAEAEIIILTKWDERRLAYPIRGQKRGLYLICYARVNRSKLSQIERDCNLNEQIVRQMFIRADHMGDVELQEAIKEAQIAATRVQLDDGQDESPRSSSSSAPARPAPAQPSEVVTTEASLDSSTDSADTAK